MSVDVRALNIRVRGRVQGVGFRYFVFRRARALGLRGYVRNEPSGDEVFIYAEGPPDALSALVSEVRIGPPAAVVETVTTEEVAPTGQWSDFQITF